MMKNNTSMKLKNLTLFDPKRVKIEGNRVKPANEFIEFKKEDIDQSIGACFEQRVKRYPDKVAVTSDDKSITYGFLINYANRVAWRIVQKYDDNGKPDNMDNWQAVALLFNHGIEMIIGLMGAIISGKTYVPLDPGYPPERLEYMLEDSEAGFIVTDSRHYPLAEVLRNKINKNIQLIDIHQINPGGSLSWPGVFVDPGQVVYVLYTSGSTGSPKGVMQSHRNALHFARVYTNALHIQQEDRLTLFSSYSFDAAKMDIFAALLNGGRLFPYDIKQDGNLYRLPAWLRKEKITIYHSIPTVYRYFTNLVAEKENENPDTFPHLRLIVLGGEAVYKNDIDKYKKYFSHDCIFINGLGPTESTVTLQYFINKETTLIKEAVPVGYPVEETDVFLVDENNKEAVVNAVGEIIYKSDYLALGYLKKPRKTNEVFTVDPLSGKGRVYRSGDLGKRLKDGSIEYAGRKDFQVKVRGYRVELGEIQNQLDRLDGINKSVVICQQDANHENDLIAFYQLARGIDIDENSLAQQLKNSLPGYMIPGSFYQLEEFPYTATGKIDRKALMDNTLLTNLKRVAYAAPGNEIQEKLVEIWREILPRKAGGGDSLNSHAKQSQLIGIDDNFFERGGHSLTAVLLAAEINKAFNINLSLAEVFKTPTIRGLSRHIPIAGKKIYESMKAGEKKEYYPMSSAQKRLYFLHQMNKTSTGYNMALVFPLGKELQKDKLESTLKQLVARHETFRTSFIPINEIPVQRVNDIIQFKLEYDDLGIEGRGGLAPLPELAAGTIKNFIRPFDLSQAPLLRSGLIKMPDGDHTWMVDMHHIISDGTSRMILTDDFLSLYNEEELEPLRIQYKDFSQWQNRLFERGDIEAQVKYWLELYPDAGSIPRLDLPADFMRPGVFTFEGDIFSFRLEREDAIKLKALGARNGGTLFMNILAALDTLFYKYTGQTDIMIGSSIAGRSHADLQQIVGMFVNKLAMRNYPRGEKTYESFLKEVIDHSLKAFENQDVQFEELVDKLAIARDPSRNPLFDISMVVQNFRPAGKGTGVSKRENPGQAEQLPLPDEKLPKFQYKSLTAKFDMTFMIHEQEQDVHIVIEYYTGIFKPETIRRLAAHFKRVVQTVIIQPSIKLDDIDITSEAEKNQLLYSWNDTAALYPKNKTLHKLFEEQVEKTPDNIAVIGQSEDEKCSALCPVRGTITYRELNEKARQLAYYLYQEKHIRQDGPVGIIMHPSINLIVAVLGTLKAGAAFVPMAPDLPEERLKRMIKDTRIEVVISQKACIRLLNRMQWECESFHTFLCMDSTNIHLEEEEEKNEPLPPGITAQNRHKYQDDLRKLQMAPSKRNKKAKQPTPLPSQAKAHHLAYILYTSGTTGNPKGVLINHRNLVNYTSWFITFAQITAKDHAVLTSSFAFDAIYTQFFSSLLTGAQLHAIARETFLQGHQLLNYIREHWITYIKVTPSLFSIIVNSSNFSQEMCGPLRFVMLGGEAIIVEDVEKARQVCPSLPFINHYGPTETTIGSSAQFIDFERFPEYKQKPTIGKPINNTQVYMLDKHLQLAAPGIAGELAIGGDGVGVGYLNHPELTAEKFLPFLYRSYTSYIYLTGDLARWSADGNIECLGRIDHQVKIRGYRLELGEIESQLLKHQKVKEAVVIVREMENGDKSLCTYIVARNSDDIPDAGVLRDYLSQILPEYMIPSYYISLDKIPLTSHGKLDRKRLPAPGGIIVDGITYTAPGDEIETQLVEIWSEVLGMGREKLSIDANFFQLGGHSLKATILVSKIHKKLDVKFPLAEVFKQPFIRAQARYIKKSAKNKFASLEPVEKREYYTLSSAQKRLYFLQQLDLQSTSYNRPLVLPLGKNIKKDKLESTLRQLIARHESLRTSFIMVNQSPVQLVHDNVELNIEYYDMKEVKVKVEKERSSIEGTGGLAPLSKNPATAFSNPQPAAALISSLIGPFDLSQAPLLRSGLIKLPDGNYSWLVDMHHIITDGTSHMILTRDFFSLYNGQKLESLRIQYKDFSQWQNRIFAVGEIETQEKYWLKLYEDAAAVPRLDLPTDFKRPEVFTFEGDRYNFMLERENVAKFKTLGLRNNGTLYMNILAALNTLFYKYTGQRDIIIGSGIAGRPHADLQPLVGMFVNTLAMRNYPEGEKTYESFLQEVIARSVKAFENQDVQFEELVERLEVERDPSRNPLFDISMVVQNFRQVGDAASKRNPRQVGQTDRVGLVEQLPLADEKLPKIRYDFLTTKFDMTFFIHEQGDDVHVNIEYYTGIFKLETIMRLSAHFKNVIKAVSKDPAVKLKDIEIISESEKNRLLFEWNDTTVPYPANKTLHRLFEEQVSKTPDSTALVGAEWPLHITYKQLDEMSIQVAHYLYDKKNTRPDDRVAIMMDSSINLIVAILGILKSGGAYVPIDPSLPPNRLKYIITDASAGTIISEKRYIRDLNRLQWECKGLHSYLCLDSYHIGGEEESEQNLLMDEELWNHVGTSGNDEISSSGWVSSYTGEPLSREEMAEYGDNILKKLEPLLHHRMRVLEIGCASGITMYQLAPLVGLYYGTDLSPVIMAKNKEQVKTESHGNIKLSTLAGHEIDKLEEGNFDLVIMNSVIQSFHGHNYLKQVLAKAITLMGEKGYLFIGDVMDLEKKDALVQEMLAFKYAEVNEAKGYTTKTDFSSELFLSEGFWEDLGVELPPIESIRFSDKLYTIENELTRFRYDVLITINKNPAVDSKLLVKNQRSTYRKAGNKGSSGTVVKEFEKKPRDKRKYQEDLSHLRHPREYGPGRILSGISAGAGNLAYIMYTSGTTGVPKGVMVDHPSVVNLVFSQSRYFKIDETERVLQFSSSWFDASVEQIFMSLLGGACLLLPNQETLLDNDKFSLFILQQSITHIHAVPAFFNHMDLPGNNRLKRIIAGGDVCPVPLAQKFSGYCDFYNEYGPTETTVTSIEMKFLAGDVVETLPRLSVGTPIDNTSVYIMDNWMKLVPIGAAGELYIGGAGVARGYLNRPELTAEKFKRAVISHSSLVIGSSSKTNERSSKLSTNDQWPMTNDRLYKTGDQVKWLTDGNIEFLGRVDQQVKIRGFRIELQEIESRLLGHEEIKDAVVINREMSDGEKHLCAYLVAGRMNDTLDIGTLRDYLAQMLPGYMIPSYFVPLDKISLTPNGKIDRKALPAPGNTVGDVETYTAPGDSVEKQLVEIWSEMLGIESDKLSIDANFFHMGGHSLKATILVSKIHKKLDVKLPLAEVFKTPTIRELAAYIRKSGKQLFESLVPSEKKEYYSLSSPQKQLYFLQQMTPESIAYNMLNVIPLPGDINKQKLTAAINQLIRRHESLRTSFLLVDEKSVQKVHPCDQLQFAITYAEINQEQVEETVENFAKPFDLSEAPLLRVGLVKIRPSTRMLLVDMHHITSDGISHDILKKEFMTLFQGEELAPLMLQYKDFSGWQNSENQKKLLEQQQAYWLETFSDQLPVLNLPTDYPRPLMQSSEGSSVNFILNEKMTRALKDIVKEANATLYMAILSVYNILLSKLSGQEDIIVGVPTAGRRHADLQNLIGMFVNTLAIRNYPTAGKKFNQFLLEVRGRTLEAFENQEYPFEDLVDKLAVNRDTSRNPVFDVLFNFFESTASEKPAPQRKNQGEADRYLHYRADAKFDFSLTLHDSDRQLVFSWRYCKKLFKKETIDRFIGYFKQIIARITDNPGIKISSIEIMPEKIKKEKLNYFNEDLNKTTAIAPLQLNLAAGFHKYKNNIALEYGALHITYRELENRAARVCQQIIYKYIPKESLIGIHIDNKIDFISVMIGILAARCIFVPLDTSLPDKQLTDMLQTANIQILFTDEENEKKLSAVKTGKRDINTLFVITPSFYHHSSRSLDCSHQENSSNPDEEWAGSEFLRYVREIGCQGEDKTYIYFTSGTTGIPNAILGKNQGLAQFIRWELETYSVNAAYRFSQLSAVDFDAFLRNIFTPLSAGGTVCIPVSRDLVLDNEGLVKWIQKKRITFIYCVPSMFRLLNSGSADANCFAFLKYIVLSGEPVNPEELRKWYSTFAHGIQLVNYYGTTETTMSKTFHFIQPGDIKGQRIPVGKPMPGARIIILDNNLKVCDRGIAGEIHIRTPYRTCGYINAPELTAQRFIKNPFGSAVGDIIHKTGDLGRECENGEIEVLGRIDRQVKIRGIRIELEGIERCLSKHDKIDQAVVINRTDEHDENYLCAYIVHKKEFQSHPKNFLTPWELRKYLSEELPGYMIPSYFVHLTRIPLTPTGKVDRQAVPEPEILSIKEGTPPRDQLERELARIWLEVLGPGTEDISAAAPGIDNNFFELGGHSLKAIQLTARVHKTFQVRIPLTVIFKTPTIRELAAYIRKSGNQLFESLIPAEKKEYYALSSPQKQLYFLQYKNPDSAAYNMPRVISLPGNIDKQKLAAAINQLINRHESLRTSFEMVDELPVQRVYDNVTIAIQYEEILNRDGGDASNNGQDIKNFTRPFDLSMAPLLRVVLLKVSTAQHLLLFDMHHILVDHISLQILGRDFTALYSGEKLPPLRIFYKEYVQWWYSTWQQERVKQLETYWTRLFPREPRVLNLPTDYPRPPVQSFEGNAVLVAIDEKQKIQLKALAQQEDATLFMTLLTIFTTLLSKLSGQDEIIVGTPTAGRQHIDVENIVGDFVNTLPIKTCPAGNKTFSAFLKEVKNHVLEAFENQGYPFNELVDRVLGQRDVSRHPIFDIAFNLVEQSEYTARTPGDNSNEARLSKFKRVTTKFDIGFVVLQSKETFRMVFEYCTKLFKQETMEMYGKNLVKIISQVVSNKQIKIKDIELMDEENEIGEIYSEIHRDRESINIGFDI